MKRLLWLMLVLPCVAQVNGNLPKLVQTYQSQTDALGGSCNSAPSSAFDIPLCDPVTSGNLVVVGINAQESGSTAYTVHDINGVVPGNFTCRTPVYDITVSLNSVICYGVATSTGNVEIQWNGTPAMAFTGVAAEFTNISGTLDVATTADTTGTPATVSNTLTTTINGDLLVTLGTTPVGESVPRSPEFFIGYNRENSFGKGVLTYTNAGLAGSQTVTHDNGKQSATPANVMILQTLAFKPPTIKVVTTAMPQASAGTAYSATLQAVGGTGAYTFACTVLPLNGLTLNTATGEISGATPTTGTPSPSCTATDGTLTSAGVSVPITINAAAFATPVIAQATATSIANFQTFPSPVCAGDTLGVVLVGYDTHFGNSWLPNARGTNNHLDDSTGAAFTQICSSSGSYAGGLAFYVGTALASTFDTVTFTKNYTGSPLSWAIMEFHNVQPTIDCGAISYDKGSATTPWSFGFNYTTPIPNEMLLLSSDITGQGSNTVSQSPFSTFINTGSFGDVLAIGQIVESSAGTYTGTTTFTSTLPDSNQGAAQIIGLRPAVANACSVSSFAGERVHRTVY